MSAFLLDLLHDLREKRLAPVAIALLVALVAVPVLLMKPAEDSGEGGTPPAGGAEAGAGSSVVQAVQEGPGGGKDGEGSALGVFDPKDPFKGPVKVAKPRTADGIAQLVTPPTSTSAPSSGGGSNGSSSGPPATGEGIDLAPGNARKPPSSGAPGVSRPVRKSYTYVVDLQFGQTGDERSRKGVKRLGILPNDRNPLVVFLGVSSNVERAVFLVDGRASQSGEGTCRPTVKSCTFLYLRDDEDRDEQFLTDEQGREYHLKLLDIRRVEVKRSTKSSAKTSRRRVRASGAAGARTRVVDFPLFAPDVIR